MRFVHAGSGRGARRDGVQGVYVHKSACPALTNGCVREPSVGSCGIILQQFSDARSLAVVDVRRRVLHVIVF